MSENAEKLSSLNKRKKLFELGFTNENIGKLKKSEIQAKCKEHSIEYENSDTKKTLIDKLLKEA